MSAPSPSAEKPTSALAVAPFRWLFVAATISYVGTFVQDIAERWLILELTGTPLPSAMMATAFVMASLVGMFPAGLLADRVDRRKLVIGSQLAMGSVAGTVAVLAWTHLVTPAVLLVAAACLGLGMSLGAPAWYALLSDILPRELVADAIALNAVSFNIARAVGPAIGGVILSDFGAPLSFAFNAASFVVVIVAVIVIRHLAQRKRHVEPTPLSKAIKDPFVLAFRDTGLRSTMIAMLGFTFGAGVVYALAPAYAKITLGASARAYGLMIGAMGFGAVLAAGVLKKLRARVAPRLLIGTTMIAYAVAASTLSRASAIGLATLLFVPAGVGWIGTFSSLSALMQVWTPDALRARMIAVYSMVHLVTWAGAASLGGALAERWSIRSAMLFGACVCLASGVLTSRLRLPPSFEGLPASLPPPAPT